MIKQLRTRFIRIAVVTLTVAMVLVIGIVNVANWISVYRELHGTLQLLVTTQVGCPDWRSEATSSIAPGKYSKRIPA